MTRRGWVLGALITLVCLALAARQVDPQRLVAELSTVDPRFLVPGVLCTFIGYVVRTFRWRVILAASAQCSFPSLFGILMSGFAANNLLPARLGELARAYLLGRQTGVRKTYSLASIFLERLFDGLVLVLLMSTISLFVDLPGWGREVELFAAFVFAGVGIAVIVVLARRDLASRLLGLLVRPAPPRIREWVLRAASTFLAGLESMRSPSVLANTALLSLVVWACEWASYCFISYGFHLDLEGAQRFVAMTLLLVVVNLGIMVPSSPGYVGTFQFFGVEALKVFRVSPESALAFTIVAHLTQYVLVTTIGVIALGRLGVSLRSLGSEARRDTGEPDDSNVEATG
ncbi:MAG: lysylphosphatidylglycerol synthase transmembrane domain-containing protein [Chloroflexota bacterium]